MSYKEFKDDNGFLYKEWRNDAGKFHREDGPAQLRYYPDGSIKLELFIINNLQHRKCGPAEIWFLYNPDGSIEHMEFWINGKYLGDHEHGFWKIWDGLTEEDRQSQGILKYLVRLS